MVNRWPIGTLSSYEFESRVLKGNPLGDPHVRSVWVYLPPGFDQSKHGCPALLALNGFTGNGAMFFNGTPFSEGLASRLDRLISSGSCPPCMVVAPDCFTRVGGSQYLNSSSTGQYQDYLVEEIVPFIQRTLQPTRWGVFGKSSGGFGAIILAMDYPDLFEAVADHSGDSNFELAYLPHFGKALDKFSKAGGPAKWLDQFWADEKPENRKDIETLDKLAMSACYSPNPQMELGIEFPFDLETGTFKPSVWEKWRNWDPIHRVARYRDNLQKLKQIYIDCGSKDEFALHWGARALVKELNKIGVTPHFEEFNDGHMSVAYRLDKSLPLLCRTLSA